MCLFFGRVWRGSGGRSPRSCPVTGQKLRVILTCYRTGYHTGEEAEGEGQYPEDHLQEEVHLDFGLGWVRCGEDGEKKGGVERVGGIENVVMA
jgi:hypothetical protein